MGRSRIAGALAGLALLALSGGCSQSAQERAASEQAEIATKFSAGFKRIAADYQTDITSIQQEGRQALAAGEQQAVLDVYRRLRDANAKAAHDLEGVAPPDASAQQHQRLIENLRGQRDTLDQVLAAATKGDDAALTGALGNLAQLFMDFATIHESLDKELAQGP